MDWDAKSVKPMSDYRIYVELEDGRKGIFDLKPYLDRGALRELRDMHYFSQVGILFGAVTWPNEQDICPDTLYEDSVKRTFHSAEQSQAPEPAVGPVSDGESSSPAR